MRFPRYKAVTNAAGDVDHRAAREIEGREVTTRSIQEPADAPDHMRHGAIHNDRPQGEEDGHCAELHALGEGAGDERRGDDGEHQLVDHVGLLWDGRHVEVERVDDVGDAPEKEMFEASDEGVAMPEGQRIAADGPDHRHQTHHGEALHHGAKDVLLADQPTIEEGQAGAGHQQDQGRGGEHPSVVARRLGCGGGGLVGFEGLLQGVDLSLRCRWGGGLRTLGARELGKAEGRNSQHDREKKDFKSATKHEFPLPKMPRAEAVREAGIRPPVRWMRRRMQ